MKVRVISVFVRWFFLILFTWTLLKFLMLFVSELVQMAFLWQVSVFWMLQTHRRTPCAGRIFCPPTSGAL